jgi:hypothetical protein
MNTLTDLRRTLDQHAEDVADPAAVARRAAVHHRVAVVRRRRRSVGGGALALVLLAGVAAAAWPRPTSDALPAAPTVLGQQAPTTLKALGYVYRTDGNGTSFPLSGSVDVPRSDAPRLYSWTTSSNTRIAIRLPDGEVWHSAESHFRDFVVVPPGDGGTMKVSAERGSVGVASYQLTDAIPAGAYSKDGITLRSEVAGSPLLRGVVSDRGETELTTSYVAPDGDVDIHLVCSGIPEGDAVHLSINGRPTTVAEADSCDSTADFDPASGTTYTMPRSGKPGRSVAVRIWLAGSDDMKDRTAMPARSAPDLRVGLGIYGPTPSLRFARTTLPRYVEHGGHLWQYRLGRFGDTPRISFGPELADRVAQVAFHTQGMTRVEFRAGTSRGGGSFSGGAGALGGLWTPAGSAVHVRLAQGRGSFGVAFYERVD